MHPDDELDRLIDTALASYADPAEALDEKLLAQRTMAFVRAAGKRRRGWLWLAVAVPALACLLALVFTLQKPVPHLQPYSAKGTTPISPAQDVSRPLPVASRHTKHRVTSASLPLRIHAKGRMPKLDQFPSPKPATETEITLLHFAKDSTAAEKQATLLARQKTTEAVTIADIRIPPLHPNFTR